MDNRRKWSLIGIEDHQGVMNSGGRVGAAHGPRAFYRSWSRLKGRHSELMNPDLIDWVQPSQTSLSQNLDHAAKRIETAQSRSPVTVVVGGGHDYGYAQLKSFRKAKKLGCINIDAHFDLRKPNPEVMSGSPFFLAIEQKLIEPARLIEFGIQRHCNSKDLWDYAEKKKIKTHLFENLRNGTAVKQFKLALATLKTCDAIVVSLDLDAVCASDAPGVSAPQSEGFFSREVIQMCEIAGRDKKVLSLGIFELNPLHDIDDRTARLAATCAYHFIESKFC